MTEYFETKGVENTERTIELAMQRAEELGIKEMVLSTTTGASIYSILEKAPDDHGMNIVAVTYHAGFKEPMQLSMSDETIKDLEEKGVKVVAATHALSGIERAVARKHQGVYPQLIIADTLRLFGQGSKVCVECMIMAADAGALSGEKIIAMGGSSKGVDTALVIKPANSNAFFDLRINEIICKPSEF